eukprot:SAG22_NODE_13351_length_409_cov_2.548387_1_plen_66_part_01
MEASGGLAGKTKKELKAAARQAGVPDDAIDDAGEAAAGPGPATRGRTALAGKTKKELKAEARQAGV